MRSSHWVKSRLRISSSTNQAILFL